MKTSSALEAQHARALARRRARACGRWSAPSAGRSTCGITVAPMMPTARYSESVPSRCGTRPASGAAARTGPIFSVSYRKPRKMIPSSAGDRELEAAVAARLQLEDRERDDAGHQAGEQQRHAEQQVQARSRRRRTRRGRSTSRSTSACSHRPHVTGRGKCSRHSSGRLRSVAMPILADRYWISIAIRFAASTTHSSR